MANDANIKLDDKPAATKVGSFWYRVFNSEDFLQFLIVAVPTVLIPLILSNYISYGNPLWYIQYLLVGVYCSYLTYKYTKVRTLDEVGNNFASEDYKLFKKLFFDIEGLFKRYVADNIKKSDREIIISGKQIVQYELNQRVSRISRRNDLVILTIAAALILAATIVIFAGHLTSLDVSAVSSIDKLKNEISNVDSKLQLIDRRIELKTDLENTNAKLANLLSQGKDLLSSKEYKELEAAQTEIKSKLDRLSFGETAAATSLDILRSNKLFWEQQRLKYFDLLNDGFRQDVSADKNGIDWKYLIATAITRVGVVIIIVYLVQILLSFYRYNTQLATIYSSLADVVWVWDGKIEHLEKLSTTFGPPKLHFGKEPKHPLQDILKTIEGRLNNVENDVSKRNDERTA